MEKSITVKVEIKVKHPLYGKFVKKSTKFHAHDEKNEFAVGDTVWIEERRPISKLKCWEVIRGEKKQEAEKEGRNYHRVERAYGSFYRSFSLPTTVNAGKIEATFADGVLTVVIPKAEEAKPKAIEVKVK